MTNTLADLRSRIADDLDRTDLNTQIDHYINRAIVYFEKEEFWFTEETVTLSTVANQETYTLPATNIKDIILAEITVNNDTYTLRKKTIEEMRQLYRSATDTGDPEDYCIYEDTLYLHPIPNAIYTIKFYYRKSYPDLVNDTDNNDYTNIARDLIETRAQYQLNLRVIKDVDEAATSKILQDDALLQLRALNERKRATQTNKVWY